MDFQFKVVEWLGGTPERTEVVLSLADQDQDSFYEAFNDALDVKVLVQVTTGKALQEVLGR